ncbi:MAG: efflux RND transporter periplasmic adaptor subunit [Gammaproteobacteria bacterium]
MNRALLAAVLFTAAVGVYLRLGGEQTSGAVNQSSEVEQAITVRTVTVKIQPMPVIVEAVGTVEPAHSVQVRPQVNGVLEEVLFREGDDVQKGQLLFRIDDQALQAGLDQAKATLARDQAELREAQAQRARLKPLAEREYITRQEYAQAVASAQALSATVQADRAQVDAARVQLGYCAIRAPIAGRSGSLAAKQGNLVSVGAATPLVIINSIQAVLVAFNIPQQYLQEVRHQAGSGEMRVAISREQGGATVARGEVIFIDNTVNLQTGTVLLKAHVPNENEALWPGEFIAARLILRLEPDAVVVPAAAVQPGQKGSFVYLVSEGEARLQPVKVSHQVESLAVIEEGLKGGEQVIVEIPYDLAPGKTIKVASEPRS